MSVHILEGVQMPIARRHELDHTDRRMCRMPRRLVEFAPPQVVRLDLAGQFLDETRRAQTAHELLYTLDANEVDHIALSGGSGPPDWAGPLREHGLARHS